MRRLRLQETGRPYDKEAWLWPNEEPDLVGEFRRAIDAVAGEDDGLRERCAKVRGRLLGALYLPAVEEALGCLIPEGLHPRLDDKRRNRAEPGAAAERCTVNLYAGRFRVSVFAEYALAEGKPMTKQLNPRMKV